MESLIFGSDIIKLWVAKTKGGWIKKRPVATQVHFVDFFFCQETKEGFKSKAWGELVGWLFCCTPDWCCP